MLRQNAKNILKKHFDIKKTNILEKKIHTLFKEEEIYLNNIYQIIGDVIEGKTFENILLDINNGMTGWNHTTFKEVKNNILEQNDFIENPFEVEEGVFECKAFDKKTGKICGSRRVYSYSKQDRSCDEGSSVYAQCVACKAKWRERG